VYRCLQGRRGVQEIREMRKNQNENWEHIVNVEKNQKRLVSGKPGENEF
jgi:hypothetical protein